MLGITLCTFTHANLLKPCYNQPTREMSLFYFTGADTEAVCGHISVLFGFQCTHESPGGLVNSAVWGQVQDSAFLISSLSSEV